MLSSTVENYLKAILRLSEEGEPDAPVPAGKIAEALAVTPGTITTMMKQLKRDGWIEYIPRKGVHLTESGRRSALQVLRRHRLTELFLVEVLHLDWAHVHEEAEVLEHVLSDRLVERIDEMLGRPAVDPHGDPIPDAQGRMREDATRRLDECSAGDYVLKRVGRDDAEFLNWLREAGLKPGAEFRLLRREPLAGVIELEIQGRALRVGELASAVLWVEGKAI
ncbi:DtxR family Mn-dependent transcriptional regulator [Haloferula luteola]|uniref:Transcriptional regulator MntR n=1 Tax=Haloferula luteola TaxID=595692 RepID=A0A840V5D1_9BACT|nr:metal-dependent transcriptional regulator [Haloferula luteola]MBB5352236.1 DtxR family Mn-dependent transcriptional regulator [Haloferula luteola]